MSATSLAGALVGALLVLLGVLYSLNLRERHPSRHRGLWRYLGTMGRTPRRAVALWAAMLGGSLLGLAITHVLNVRPDRPTLFLFDALEEAVFVLAAALAWTLHWGRRRDGA